jgi:hypothetical protein
VTPGILGRYLTLVVLLTAAAAILSVANRSTKKELVCRFSQALLPLGLAMWAAHLLFHLITGWATLDPALHQAAADLGWHLFGPAHWGMDQPPLTANTLLSVQLLLLDAGLLLTLYLGWRLARQWATSAGRTVLLLLPWATMVAVAYAMGVWIMLQPMQMRGVMMNP